MAEREQEGVVYIDYSGDEQHQKQQHEQQHEKLDLNTTANDGTGVDDNNGDSGAILNKRPQPNNTMSENCEEKTPNFGASDVVPDLGRVSRLDIVLDLGHTRRLSEGVNIAARMIDAPRQTRIIGVILLEPYAGVRGRMAGRFHFPLKATPCSQTKYFGSNYQDTSSRQPI
ncbi:hypothetical protein PIB30_071510 [Stylosanthes scabra]|uniref:Uncharacterized protein n=1 Tax=Stylosanthes scabra TaxID=79078 RepID=A0ABU6WRL8_9FABA|nr:hypothetical protein [Stylosanthes scabra]